MEKKRGGKLKWVIIVVIVIFVAAAAGSGDDESEPATSEQASSEQTGKKGDDEKRNGKGAEDKETNKSTPKLTKKSKSKKETKKEYIKSCKAYEYKKVLRNPDKYIGKRIKIKIKISSVHEKGLMTPTKYYFARSNDKYDIWMGDQYGVFDKRDSEKPKLLEGDIIEVYGEIAEPEETKSLIVNSQELFCIDMKYVKLISE